MYRRNNSGSGCVFPVVMLGILIGAIYFWMDQPAPSAPDTQAVVAPVVTEAPVQAASVPNIVQSPVPTNVPFVLMIPRANVTANIVSLFLDNRGSWNLTYLGRNVGHLEGTAALGERGNIVLSGHNEMADGTAGVFSQLDRMETGDEIIIMRGGVPMVYYVDSVTFVDPDDLSVIYPSDEQKLTLISCDDYDFLSNTYRKRVVVTAYPTVQS